MSVTSAYSFSCPRRSGFLASVVSRSVVGDSQAQRGGQSSHVRPRSSLSIRGHCQATEQERVSRCSEMSTVGKLGFIFLAS